MVVFYGVYQYSWNKSVLNQKLYLWPVSVHLDFDNIVIEEAPDFRKLQVKYRILRYEEIYGNQGAATTLILF